MSGVSTEIAESLYEYGCNLGLAYQIVDDILDFTGSTKVLGKPAGSDLASGNLTAPVLYTLAEKPYLEVLIEREFSQEGDLEEALTIIREGNGLEQARKLAAHHAHLAVESLACLKPSASCQSLKELTDNYVLNRLY